jgi:hypothetical protein
MVAAAKTKRGRMEPPRPGDRVKFRFGLSDVIGEITEVVGPIGKGRRTVYRVEFPMGGDEPLATQLTSEEFERVQ